VKPTNGFINARCPKGEQSESFSVVLYNPQSTTQNYQLSLENVQCNLEETSFSITGKSQHSVIVKDCDCPTNETITGSLQITNGACTAEVPIQLYNNFLGRLFSNQEFLYRGLLGTVLLSLTVLGLIVSVKYL
jgi:hypothetical protein